MVRVNDSYALYADSVAKINKIYRSRRVAFKILARGRVLLVTGHTCDRVIKDYNGGICSVVCHIYKACHTAVHKSGITDDCNGVLLSLFAKSLVKAVEGRDRCTHADS